MDLILRLGDMVGDDMERHVATCIAQQWGESLDDACRCSGADVIAGHMSLASLGDGSLTSSRALDWAAARQVREILLDAARGIVVTMGSATVIRDCCVGTLLALLGRLSVHQVSALLV